MIAIRTMFATLMAVMVAGSFGQIDSSSSTGAANFTSSSSIDVNATISSTSDIAPNATISSTGIVANSSTGLPSLSSSSSGMGPIIPGFNESSSSSVWLMSSSSSSTGSSENPWFPAGTQEVTYSVELATGVAPVGLTDALARDFAETVVRALSSNVSASTIFEFIRTRINDPITNQTIQAFAVGPANTTVVAIVLGNVTNVIAVSARDLANNFATAAAAGDIVVTESAVYGVNVYPQQVIIVESPLAESSTGVDGGNGASSVASASLLIGSMIAALALVF